MYHEILEFWFEEIDQSKWWVKDVALDQRIIRRFSKIHDMAIKCELFDWRASAEGRLAEIIVLDQFSRNMFRDSTLAFSNDPLALALAQEAISVKADSLLEPQKRSFLYLPFMHSESRKIHDLAAKLYSTDGMQSNLDFELKHKSIINRFGRYPHRNEVLHRKSTQEELIFLKEPESSF